MTTPASTFNEDYFLRGPSKGVSNYVDYSWQEGPTMALAKRVIEVFGIKENETLLDYGTARGYLPKALRRLGVPAFGFDISEWAIKNCDPEVELYVSNNPEFLKSDYDYVYGKDVMEHLDIALLRATIDQLLLRCRQSMFIIVPLSREINGPYVRKEDNQDATHVIRWPLQEWMEFLQMRCGETFTLTGSWHIPGLKPTSFSSPRSCGFFRMDRV